jgi:hypothetical protein
VLCGLLMLMLVMTRTPTSGQRMQSVSLPYLTAEVSIGYTASNRALVLVTFSTSDRAKENVNCLNAYRDIKYVLRGASGATMKGDPTAWTRELDTMTEQYSHPCEQLGWKVKYSRALVGALFPNAAHGQYMLYMTLAPRGRSDTAAFQPVVVTL